MGLSSPDAPAPPAPDFAQRLVRWQRAHGRHGLPWQQPRSPYRVWLSEVMLQQTQVATVRAYFERFVTRWPDVHALAQAELDDVLAAWSGLGYYSRARHLHACAGAVVARFGGEFPTDERVLASLPGIGPSTAAAIAALAFGQRAAILDGNVQRVWARHRAWGADLSRASARQALLTLARQALPTRAADMPAYTQGLMDLGATVCTPRQPRCIACPVAADCLACAHGEPTRWPVKSRKPTVLDLPLWLLWLQRSDGAVWLARRPTPGIWGGLWAPPVFASAQALRQAWAQGAPTQVWPVQRHVLTHRVLHLHRHAWTRLDGACCPQLEGAWYPPGQWPTLGMPQPVQRWLAQAVVSLTSTEEAQGPTVA